jgi:hypothetical protein
MVTTSRCASDLKKPNVAENVSSDFPGLQPGANRMSILNLRIGGRLFGGFGAVVLFGAVLACFGVSQLWEIATRVERMTEQSNNAIRVVQISSELQAVRRAILRYNFDHDEPSYAEAGKRIDDIAGLLDTAAKETRSDERRAA